jgi:hypothetical protein
LTRFLDANRQPPRYPSAGQVSLENAVQNRAWQNHVDARAAASRLQIRREQKIVHVRIVSGAILEYYTISIFGRTTLAIHRYSRFRR